VFLYVYYIRSVDMYKMGRGRHLRGVFEIVEFIGYLVVEVGGVGEYDIRYEYSSRRPKV
jgi:hypothetical protein